jgi:aryl-alcohol dehydrogenase-like predicted oxidoreductase
MTMREHNDGDLDRDPAAVVNAALDAGGHEWSTRRTWTAMRHQSTRAIAGRRDEVLLATKFGVLWRDDGNWYVRADAMFVRQSCEASLRRLAGSQRSSANRPRQVVRSEKC